jgi:hypothetical protein
MTFTLSITIPDSLLEVEEAELVSSTLQALAKEVSAWQAIPTNHRLLDRAGKVVGWAGLNTEDDGHCSHLAPWIRDLADADELACLRDVDT